MACRIVQLCLITVPLVLAGCASLEPVPDELSPDAYACMQLYDPDGDPMRRKNGELAPESSFLTINRSIKALEWRQALADEAQQSLDIQYFLWRPDDTGALLARHVLAAADRGVAVRVLMDDFDSVAWNPRAVVLNTHPNIEFRVFNPFKKRRGGWGARSGELLTNFGRLNHRMHNKLFMADAKAAVVGGRNIGDEYFGAGSPFSNRDYDLLTIGPVVEELTDSFETFWNSAWAYPLEDLPAKESEQSLQDLRAELEARISGSDLLAADYAVEPQDWNSRIADARDRLISGRARAVFDCPPSDDNQQFPVQTAYTLRKVSEQTREKILIVSPYFVPLEQGLERFRSWIDDGIDLTIYTTSLAATDKTTAFSGYAKYRPEVLEMGAKIRELRPDAKISAEQQVPSSPADYQSLHAKLLVFDQRWVYVGSFNFDPRAAYWNTELGLLVDSPELTAQVLDDFSGDLLDSSSWRVELRENDKGKSKLYWISGETETDNEPSRGVGQKVSKGFYGLFPMDEQL